LHDNVDVANEEFKLFVNYNNNSSYLRHSKWYCCWFTTDSKLRWSKNLAL